TALSGLGEGLDTQAAAIGETLEGVARSLKSAFGRAFDQILRTGEADLGGLIRGLSRDLARLGLDTVFGALGKQASGLLGGLIGRAAGGPVATEIPPIWWASVGRRFSCRRRPAASRPPPPAGSTSPSTFRPRTRRAFCSRRRRSSPCSGGRLSGGRSSGLRKL
ncbi:MAG: hypothetical protein ACLFV8_13860, partial [Alphaproteobacteria bacterium]